MGVARNADPPFTACFKATWTLGVMFSLLFGERHDHFD